MAFTTQSQSYPVSSTVSPSVTKTMMRLYLCIVCERFSTSKPTTIPSTASPGTLHKRNSVATSSSVRALTTFISTTSCTSSYPFLLSCKKLRYTSSLWGGRCPIASTPYSAVLDSCMRWIMCDRRNVDAMLNFDVNAPNGVPIVGPQSTITSVIVFIATSSMICNCFCFLLLVSLASLCTWSLLVALLLWKKAPAAAPRFDEQKVRRLREREERERSSLSRVIPFVPRNDWNEPIETIYLRLNVRAQQVVHTTVVESGSRARTDGNVAVRATTTTVRYGNAQACTTASALCWPCRRR